MRQGCSHTHMRGVRMGVAALAMLALGLLTSGGRAVAEPVAGEGVAKGFPLTGVSPFEFVAPSLCGLRPTSKEAFEGFMKKNGFHENGTGQWQVSEEAGTTKVTCLVPVMNMATIIFVPAQRVSLPAAIIEAMRSAATEVVYIGPDKLSFGFKDVANLADCEESNEVIVALKDGAWLESDLTVTWKAKP